MTLLSDHEAATDSRALARVALPGGRTAIVRTWSGAFVTLVGLAGWTGWLAWRVAHPTLSIVGLLVLVLELIAYAGALVVTAGLVVSRPQRRRDRRDTDHRRPLPLLLAESLDLGTLVSETACPPSRDDTGEIAWARRGIRVLAEQRPGRIGVGSVRDAAWSVVAVDGLRRAVAVALLVVVLFSGSAPFTAPPDAAVVMLAVGIALVATGHWMLSAGHIRPGARLIWSMSSIGAGLGDGVSRSGRPIRWMATMATLVVLNMSIALRGISDRWTHGLGPMERDARVASMVLAFCFVAAGGAALRRMPRPDGGFYGATRRLEEDSVRRLALALTLLIALIGFVAGTLPTDASPS